MTPRRLVVVGSVIVDVVLVVPSLPVRGGDVLATDGGLATGGGFNVLSAASRQGLPAALAGHHGTGPFGDQVRRDLAAEGVEVLLPRTAGRDTGFCVGLVEDGGERTYATREGVEGSLTAAALSPVRPGPGDAVYLSGYDVAYTHGAVVAAWFGALADDVLTVFDPGPLAGGLPAGPLGDVLRRADWLSANRREAGALLGDGPGTAADAASALLAAGRARRGVVVRDGAAGCAVASAAGVVPVPVAVPLEPREVVDTSGAGDTHVGAFVAALGRGLTPADACGWANAAAARCVTRRGPAQCPPYAVTEADVARASAGSGDPEAL